MKLYVKESIVVTPDGDRLVVIQTYQSKPTIFTYIIWTEE